MSQTLITAPRRARFARAITTTKHAWATDYVQPDPIDVPGPNQFYLKHLSAQRRPEDCTRRTRQAHQVAVFQALIAQEQARLTPNVCLALPLAGRALVPTAVVRYQ